MLSVAEQAKVLRQANYRLTRSRLAVLQVLAEHDEALNATSIHRLGQQYHPGLGRVSVYRCLDLLVELGLVRHVHGEDGCHTYAQAGQQEGHYLICEKCGQVQEFPCVGLDEILERVGRRYGFRIQQHLLQLGGLCSGCQAEYNDSSVQS